MYLKPIEIKIEINNEKNYLYRYNNRYFYLQIS